MNRIIIVTGASKGIGREIAKTLAQEGHTVIANYNKSEEQAKQLKKELEEKINKKDFEHQDILGDIIISIEKVKEQAEEYGHSLLREFSFLVVHSLLHLFGYDHMEEDEREEMEEKQREIMKKLQILR